MHDVILLCIDEANYTRDVKLNDHNIVVFMHF